MSNNGIIGVFVSVMTEQDQTNALKELTNLPQFCQRCAEPCEELAFQKDCQQAKEKESSDGSPHCWKHKPSLQISCVSCRTVFPLQYNRFARLLSDNNTSFNYIRDNNDFFTYCSATAAHSSHRTLCIINCFTCTFRGLLYKTFRNFRNRYSWHDVYKDVLNTYNSAKHNTLFLHRCSCTGNLKRFHHVQNKVQYNQCLCLHIILRCYFYGVKNYKPNTMYDKNKMFTSCSCEKHGLCNGQGKNKLLLC